MNLKLKSEIYELLRQDNVQALKITLTTNFLSDKMANSIYNFSGAGGRLKNASKLDRVHISS
jgi:hypothetical protein